MVHDALGAAPYACLQLVLSARVEIEGHASAEQRGYAATVDNALRTLHSTR